MTLCATCLSEHEGDSDSPTWCWLFAPTLLDAFHASKLRPAVRGDLNTTWHLQAWLAE